MTKLQHLAFSGKTSACLCHQLTLERYLNIEYDVVTIKKRLFVQN